MLRANFIKKECKNMYRLGIDLGGTNIVAGVVNKEYKIISKASCKTQVPRPESEICDSMAEVALKAIDKAKLTLDDISSIGIGVPGAVNPKTGVIEYSANLFFLCKKSYGRRL